MHRPSQVERAFSVVSIMLYSGAILPLFRTFQSGDSVSADGDMLSQLVYLVLYVITFFYSSNYWKPLKTALVANKGLLIIFSLVVLSVVWSDVPLLTARRVVALVASSLFGYYLAVRYSLQAILQLVNQALFITAVLSVLTAVALPNLGLMGAMQEGGFHEGAWKGVYIHKNTLGRLMVIHTLTAFLLYSISKKKVYWLEIALAVFLIVMSRSSTALVLVVFIISFSYLLKTFQLNGYGLAFIGLSLVMIALLGISYVEANYDLIFELMGKDPTLTGRTALWEQVMKAISKQPWIGHGFGGFWIGGRSQSARISQELNWEIPNAHNGFLDFLLDLGYIGFVVFVIAYVASLLSFMKAYSLEKQRVYEWGVMYMLLFLVYNFLESNLLRQNGILWILFVTTLAYYSLLTNGAKRKIIRKNSTSVQPLKPYSTQVNDSF